MEGRLFRRAEYPSFFLWKSGRGYDKMRGKGKTLWELPANFLKTLELCPKPCRGLVPEPRYLHKLRLCRERI